MRVFNTSKESVMYKGRPIPGNGGSLDFPGLSFVPDRDRELEKKHVLAFGALPDWFVQQKKMEEAQQAKKTATATVVAAPKETPIVVVEDRPMIEEKVTLMTRAPEKKEPERKDSKK